MLDVLQEDVPLSHDMFDFVALHNGLLLEHLDSVALPRGLLSAKIHLQGRGCNQTDHLNTN